MSTFLRRPTPSPNQPPMQGRPLPRPGAEDPAVAKAIAAGRATTEFRPSGVAMFIALACLAGIALSQNSADGLTRSGMIFTGLLGGVAVFLALVAAYFTYRFAGRSNTAASNLFVLGMLLTSGLAVLARGPVHAEAMTQLNTHWPQGAQILTKVQEFVAQADPEAGGSTKAAKPTVQAPMVTPATKGAPIVKVRRRDGQSVTTAPTTEPR